MTTETRPAVNLEAESRFNLAIRVTQREGLSDHDKDGLMILLDEPDLKHEHLHVITEILCEDDDHYTPIQASAMIGIMVAEYT